MRKVELNDMELNKFEIIKNLVDNNGNKKSVACKLNLSLRQINRLILTYKNIGKAGFSHGNKGKCPKIAFDVETKSKVISLHHNEIYKDANFKHFSELLLEHEGIKISDTTIHKWLQELDIISPKATRKTRKKLKTKLKARKSCVTSKKEQVLIENKIELLDHLHAHPRRPRAAYMGEVIQMDASSFIWFGNILLHLHVAIDDATGKIVGAWFDTQETLNGYYHVLSQILLNYGIPVSFWTDKRTVFTYLKKDAPSDEEDTFTQFSYACKELGIAIETSSIPQSKGRVERLNQTLQSRLPVELRIAGVTTIEQANIFLESYLEKFNDDFSLPINDTKNAFEAQLSKDEINKTLAIINKRVIDAGHSAKYHNHYYRLVTENMVACYFPKGTSVLVIKCFDGSLYANVLDHLYLMEKIPERLEKSKELDQTIDKKPRKKYIPPLSHPWKQASYNAFISKQKHRKEYLETPIN